MPLNKFNFAGPLWLSWCMLGLAGKLWVCKLKVVLRTALCLSILGLRLRAQQLLSKALFVTSHWSGKGQVMLGKTIEGFCLQHVCWYLVGQSKSDGQAHDSGLGNGNPLLCFLLGNLMDIGSWWATVHGFTKRGWDVPEHSTQQLLEGKEVNRREKVKRQHTPVSVADGPLTARLWLVEEGKRLSIWERLRCVFVC